MISFFPREPENINTAGGTHHILGFVFLGILILKKYLILGSGYFYGANKKLTDFLSAGVSQQHTKTSPEIRNKTHFKK